MGRSRTKLGHGEIVGIIAGMFPAIDGDGSYYLEIGTHVELDPAQFLVDRNLADEVTPQIISISPAQLQDIAAYINTNQSEFKDILKVRGVGSDLNEIVYRIDDKQREEDRYGAPGRAVIHYLSDGTSLARSGIARKGVLEQLALNAQAFRDADVIDLLNNSRDKLILGALQEDVEYQEFEDFCKASSGANVLDSLLEFPTVNLSQEIRGKYLDFLLEASRDVTTSVTADSYLTGDNFGVVLEKFISLRSEKHLKGLLAENDSLMNLLRYDPDAASEILSSMQEHKEALKTRCPGVVRIAEQFVKEIGDSKLTKSFERGFLKGGEGKSSSRRDGSILSRLNDEDKASKEDAAEAKRAAEEARKVEAESGELIAKSQETKQPAQSQEFTGSTATATKAAAALVVGVVSLVIAAVAGAAAPVVALACLTGVGVTYAGATGAQMAYNANQVKSASVGSEASAYQDQAQGKATVIENDYSQRDALAARDSAREVEGRGGRN